jgi:Icc protein
MTLLIQITDTHILPRGELLYGVTDTAAHLAGVVKQINHARPRADLVMITGDLADRGDRASYRQLVELIEPLEMPVYVIPGNHDNPELMAEEFSGTTAFPVTDETFQYVIDEYPCRILALNSQASGTDLPVFTPQRLDWLQAQLACSDKPVVIAIHHPPMMTGVELSDMGGSDWFQGIKSVLAGHPQVKLVICGHCHMDLSGRIGAVPVYMAPSSAYQLVAAREAGVAPASVPVAGVPVLHQWIGGEFVSGSFAWPSGVEEERIDQKSGRSWQAMKDAMTGSRR